MGTRREESLRDAALVHLTGGNIERCCEILVSLDDWDKALSLAPAVSFAYWQGLMARGAKKAMEAEVGGSLGGAAHCLFVWLIVWLVG